jgi:hypothetical protein
LRVIADFTTIQIHKIINGDSCTTDFRQPLKKMDRRCAPAISGDLLSAVISTCYILGFRKDNFNVFNNLAKN